jgi:hypothetical protein
MKFHILLQFCIICYYDWFYNANYQTSVAGTETAPFICEYEITRGLLKYLPNKTRTERIL